MGSRKPLLGIVAGLVLASVFIGGFRSLDRVAPTGEFVTATAENMFDGPVIEKSPAGPPPKISAAPLWQRAGAITFTDDSAIVATEHSYYDIELSALNPHDGAARWTIPPGHRLPGSPDAHFTTMTDSNSQFAVVDGAQGTGVIPVEYAHFACGLCPRSSLDVTEEFGIAGISVATGETVWKHAAIPSEPINDDNNHNLHSAAVVGTTILAVVELDGYPSLPHAEPRSNKEVEGTRTIALDALTGEKLWEAEHTTRLQGVAGNVALAYVADASGTPRTVVLDPRTGKEKYDYNDRFDGDVLTYARNDHGVLNGGRIVNLTTGEIVAKSPSGLGFCFGDAATIACNTNLIGAQETSYNRLVIFDIGQRRFSLAGNPLDEEYSYLDAMWEGHFVADARGMTDVWVYDRAGVRAATLPGVPVAATDEYVVLRSTDPSVPVLSVHSVQ